MPWKNLAGSIADLVLRQDCVCCGRIIADNQNQLAPAGKLVGSALCQECGLELGRAPQRIEPRVGETPVFSCGPYGGAHRALVLAAKDHVRTAAINVMGRVMATAWQFLGAGGQFPDPAVFPVVVVPAPTTLSAERDRGGDIVTKAAKIATASSTQSCVIPVARMTEATVDSVGLSAVQRRVALAENMRFNREAIKKVAQLQRQGCRIVIVDDVCTTGATINQLAVGLAARGIRPNGALTVCHA